MFCFFNIGGLKLVCQLGCLDKVLIVAYTDPMKGWIYIMSNASFSDGRIKIGMSSKDPVERKSELESSGVPEPFVIEYKAMVDDYQKVEQQVHRHLDNYRPNKKREFFTCSISDAIITIRTVAEVNFEESNFKISEETSSLGQRRADLKKVWNDGHQNFHAVRNKFKVIFNNKLAQFLVLFSPVIAGFRFYFGYPLKFIFGLVFLALSFLLACSGAFFLYFAYSMFNEESFNYGVTSLFMVVISLAASRGSGLYALKLIRLKTLN